MEDYTLNVINNLAVTETAKTQIIYYPNTVKEILNISDNKKITAIHIYDMDGNKVFEKIINSTKAQVNLSSLIKGVYTIKTFINGETKSFKIIKE